MTGLASGLVCAFTGSHKRLCVTESAFTAGILNEDGDNPLLSALHAVAAMVQSAGSEHAASHGSASSISPPMQFCCSRVEFSSINGCTFLPPRRIVNAGGHEVVALFDFAVVVDGVGWC